MDILNGANEVLRAAGEEVPNERKTRAAVGTMRRMAAAMSRSAGLAEQGRYTSTTTTSQKSPMRLRLKHPDENPILFLPITDNY